MDGLLFLVTTASEQVGSQGYDGFILLEWEYDLVICVGVCHRLLREQP